MLGEGIPQSDIAERIGRSHPAVRQRVSGKLSLQSGTAAKSRTKAAAKAEREESDRAAAARSEASDPAPPPGSEGKGRVDDYRKQANLLTKVGLLYIAELVKDRRRLMAELNAAAAVKLLQVGQSMSVAAAPDKEEGEDEWAAVMENISPPEVRKLQDTLADMKRKAKAGK